VRVNSHFKYRSRKERNEGGSELFEAVRELTTLVAPGSAGGLHAAVNHRTSITPGRGGGCRSEFPDTLNYFIAWPIFDWRFAIGWPSHIWTNVYIYVILRLGRVAALCSLATESLASLTTSRVALPVRAVGLRRPSGNLLSPVVWRDGQ
jgi:hypothetical protein